MYNSNTFKEIEKDKGVTLLKIKKIRSLQFSKKALLYLENVVIKIRLCGRFDLQKFHRHLEEYLLSSNKFCLICLVLK